MDSFSAIGGPSSAFAFGNAAFSGVSTAGASVLGGAVPPQGPGRLGNFHLPFPPQQQVEQAPRQSLGDTADGKHQANTSINIFRSFIHRLPNGELDATGVTSEKCYQLWLNSRKSKPSCPEKAFQRALSGHITGVDGRVPFDQEEEEAILRAVRRKARWECFKHCDIKFGESGFRTKGFHEKAYAGEILKTQPKKRAKRAMEKIRNISRTLLLEEQARNEEEEEEDDVEVDDEEEGSSSSSTESSATSPSSTSGGSSPRRHEERRRKKVPRFSNVKHYQIPPPPATAASTRYPLRSVMGQVATVPVPVQLQQPFVDRERSGSASSSSSSVYYPHSVFESSASALTMNIPSVVGAPISAAASILLGILVNMVLSLGALGLPYTKMVLALHRTIQYSRGWFTSPRIDKAQELMARLEQQHPNDYIMLCDFTQDPLNRYLLQNELAKQMFGKITQQHGGCKGMRVAPKELWNALKMYAEAAMLPPGQEVRTEIMLFVRSQERLCEVFVSMDDATHVVVERGRLMDGPLRAGNVSATANALSSSSASVVGAGLKGSGNFLNLARDIPNMS
jgi:hypothetical protein